MKKKDNIIKIFDDKIISLNKKISTKFAYTKFDKNLNIAGGIQKVTKETIITNYYNEIKVIPKIMAKNFDKDILSLNNLTVADLDHNELESLKLKVY